MIRDYIKSTQKILESLDEEKVTCVKNRIVEHVNRGSNIFVMGNGGSGATASHFVCDMNKGVADSLDKRIKMTCLNDSMPLVSAYSNDQSYADIYSEQLRNFLEEDDLVIAFSGSGNSPNVIKAIEYAQSVGAYTIGFTGLPGGRLGEISDFPVIVGTSDMQHIEDVHMIITHMMMKLLCAESVA